MAKPTATHNGECFRKPKQELKTAYTDLRQTLALMKEAWVERAAVQPPLGQSSQGSNVSADEIKELMEQKQARHPPCEGSHLPVDCSDRFPI